MELNVKVTDKFYLNPDSGAIKTQVRSSIPLTAPVTVRKLKPSGTYAKKIGDVWLGSNKMSFSLLLSYLLLKNEKNNAIGFFKYSDGYLYIEASVDMYKHTTIKTGYTSSTETPTSFMTVSGKAYDAVFGFTDAKNINFDFVKAQQEISRKLTPVHIGAILVGLFLSVFLISHVLQKPPKIELPKTTKKAAAPPPLTAAENNKLLHMLKDRFITKYGEIQEELRRSNTEKRLKNITFTTVPNPDGQTMSANFTYASYYPFVGSKKEGNNYIWSKSYTERLTRQDLSKYAPAPAAADVCMRYFLKYEVTERTTDHWTLSLKEPKHPRIAFLMNLLYECPSVIKDMTIDDNGLSGTVFVDAT